MREILEFRSQIYKPTNDTSSSNLSGVDILNYHDEDSTLPELLIVFELNAEQEFDSVLITQLIRDVFHDFFFKREIFSNVQIVEEAILDVKSRILKLLKASDKNFLDFNFICAVFDQDNLSVVRYGKTFAHVFRDGILKELSFVSEGYFGSAKGNIKSGDLFILSTDSFNKKYVSDDLVKKGLKIANEDLEPSSASLILYFNKSVGSTKTSINLQSKRIKKKIQKNIIKYQGILISLLVAGILISSYRFYVSKEQEKIQNQNQTLIDNSISVLGATAVDDLDKYSSDLLDQISIIGKSNIEGKEELITQLKQKYSEVNQIEEKEYKLVKDFKEINPRVDLNSMVIARDALYILDGETGRIFYSDLPKMEFQSKDVGVKNPAQLDLLNRTFVVKNNEGLSFLTLDLNKDGNDLKLDNFGKFTGFSTFIYEVDGDKMFKIDVNADEPKRELWATDSAFSGAKDLDLDYDIFVLTNNSQILRYSAGQKKDFNFENKRFTLNKMFIDSSLGKFYFSGDSKFYVFSTTGKFLKQILNTQFTGEIKDFVVYPNKILFITNSKLFEISL